MKLWFRIAVAGLLLGGVAGLSGGFSVSRALADVNDFTFSSMHATYLLGVDETGHSTLTTIEKLTAVFPQADQNHGIQRAIPVDYDGHGTNLTLESVENQDGVALGYTAEASGGFLVITIAADEFVHGAQTYVLTYTQRDVTLTPANGDGNQEFYWDVNGTGWSQPFDSVVAVVMMPGHLADALTGSAACYQGPANSNTECSSLEQAALGTTAQFTATANALAAGENLTVAIEFVPGTFIERDTDFFASPLAIPLLLFSALGVGILSATLVIRRTRWRDHPGRGIIIAEYGPPPAITPLVASRVFGRRGKAIAAAIVNLAVAGNIRILDEQQVFTLELVSTEGVLIEERELLEALFGSQLVPGARRDLTAVDADVSKKLATVRSNVTRAIRTSGFRGSIGKVLPGALIGAAVLVAMTGVSLALAMGAEEFGGPVPFLFAMLTIVAALVTFTLSVNVHPLTERGTTLRDHLRGLREFIILAEADRLRVLQSPTGALRVPIDVTDARLRVKLTEKVLPYAVLFGLENEWAKELASLYAENKTQPTWYVGGPGFNALLFSASLTAFASTASTSWSASSSSSGMGGSGGGGFSGGGGGGGGGGGV